MSCKACGEVLRVGGQGARSGGGTGLIEEEDVPVHFPQAAESVAPVKNVFHAASRQGSGRPAVPLQPARIESADLPENFISGRVGLRLAILAVLLLPILLMKDTPWLVRALACILPVIMTGTFHTAKIDGRRFHSRFYFGYVPLQSRRCQFDTVTSIDARYGWTGPSWMTYILFGPVQWLFGCLFESLIPALGGAYQLHLVTAKGREVLAWRGHSERKFQQKLALLKSRTHAEVRSR